MCQILFLFFFVLQVIIISLHDIVSRRTAAFPSFYFPPISSKCIISYSTQSLRSVALVGADSLAVDELIVGVGGPHDEPLLRVDDGQGSEADLELAAPARADLVLAAVNVGDGSARGQRVGGHAVAARRGGVAARVGVDAELDLALGVGVVAGAGKVGDGPLGHVGDHGLGLAGRGGDGTGEGGQGEDGGCEEHFGFCEIKNCLVEVVEYYITCSGLV
ncbi:hypothetical protein ACKVWC_011561 [Pyricularia oryzae]